jgi:histidinol-phosphate aminotransferase
MSRFFSKRYAELTPYTPGEQPQDMAYTKLNTNESPFPPSEKALAWAAEHTKSLNLYCDPACRLLTAKLAEIYEVTEDMVLVTNGSDETLNFAFMAFCDEDNPALFPDITYGFYPVYAQLNHVPFEEIPLTEDFSIDPEEYKKRKGTIFLANPNAPTGKAIPAADIEKLVAADPDRIVAVDEAYVDFGAESCVPLVKKYDNILVIQTYSKSRSLAGARLGYAIACPALIADLNTIKFSTNPYNINSYSAAVGFGSLLDDAANKENNRIIAENRVYTVGKLKELGFDVVDSKANFVFAKHGTISGQEIYEKLKANGVLVRHFTKERIKDYNRITIGTKEQMDILFDTFRKIWG